MVNLNAIKAMSYREYAQHLLQYTNAHKGELARCVNIDLSENGMIGHAAERHIGLSIPDLVKQNVEKQKGIGTFSDLQTYEKCLDILFQKHGMSLAKVYFETINQHKKDFILDINMNTTVGYGIDVCFQLVNPKSVRFVFAPSKDPNSELGFIIKTAYPNMEQNLEYTDTNYRPMAEAYIKPEDLEKDFIIRQFKDMGYDCYSYKNHIVIPFYLKNEDKIFVHMDLEGNININYINKEFDKEIDFGDVVFNKYHLPGRVQESILDIPEAFDEIKENLNEYQFMERIGKHDEFDDYDER